MLRFCKSKNSHPFVAIESNKSTNQPVLFVRLLCDPPFSPLSICNFNGNQYDRQILKRDEDDVEDVSTNQKYQQQQQNVWLSAVDIYTFRFQVILKCLISWWVDLNGLCDSWTHFHIHLAVVLCTPLNILCTNKIAHHQLKKQVYGFALQVVGCSIASDRAM